jgi:putative transposase
MLEENNISISMDGKGRFVDNIYCERLWRTIKQEEVYLKQYSTPLEAIQSMEQYVTYYNEQRPHQSLNYLTPNQVYYGTKLPLKS